MDVIKNPKGLEGLLVKSWQGWDLIDTGVFQFYNVYLCEDVGFPENLWNKPLLLVLDMTNSNFQIYDEGDEPIYSGKITTLVFHKE